MLTPDHKEHLRFLHDFNEELTILLNTATIADGLLGPEHPASPAMVELKRSLARCTDLTRQMVRH